MSTCAYDFMISNQLIIRTHTEKLNSSFSPYCLLMDKIGYCYFNSLQNKLEPKKMHAHAIKRV